MKLNTDGELYRSEACVWMAYADELEVGDEIWVADELRGIVEHRAWGVFVEVMAIVPPELGASQFKIHVEQAKVLTSDDRFWVTLESRRAVPTSPRPIR